MNFKSTPDKLLSFVDTYQMNELKVHFENEMINKLSISNAARYLRTASQCNALQLKEKVLDFLKLNLYKVNETDEWKRLAETEPQLTSEVYKQILIDK